MSDPELALLAGKLPDTIFASRALTTTSKYQRAYDRWKQWAVAKELPSLPVNVAHFACYLQYLGDSTGSKAAVEEAVNSVAWVQRMAGQETVLQDGIIRSVMEGLQRMLAKPRVKKEPITPGMLQEIVASLHSPPTLTDLRLGSICLLSFAAFLRFDEVSKLCCDDIKFFESKMEVHIKSSKTDQYRQGAIVPIARSGLTTCPVDMLRRYFTVGGLSTSSNDRLFRGISATKNGESLRQGGALSYTRMREIVLDKIRGLGYDAKRFGLHSFRAGGATAAANAPGVSDRHFKRHGRWKSESAKDGYVKDSEESRLKVTKSLGI